MTYCSLIKLKHWLHLWRATGKGKDYGGVEKVLSAASSLADDDEKLSGKSFVVSGVSRNEAPTPTISLSVAKATEAKDLSTDSLSSAASRSKSLMEQFLINHVLMESSAVNNLLSPDVVANVIVVETLLDVAAAVSNTRLFSLYYGSCKI